MKCPICEKGSLDDNGCDYELFCDECGSTFLLEYAGMYKEDAQEMTHDGFEPKEFLDKYKDKIQKWKGFE